MITNFTTNPITNGSDMLQMELFKSYPEWLIHFSLAFYVILIIVGIPGNLVTIIALGSYQKYRNATAILIINLHVCNLIFCFFILPLTVSSYSVKRWTFGNTICRVYALMKFSLIATSHFTVIVITLNRYVMVCHPFQYPRFNKKTVLITSLVVTWIVGICIFLPTFFGIWGNFDMNPLEGICTMVRDKNNVYPKDFFVCFAFVGPCVIMSVCYGRIWWVLKKRRQDRTKKKAANIRITLSSGESDCPSVSIGYACQTPSASQSYSEDSELCKSNESAVVSVDNLEQLTTVDKGKRLQLPTKKDKKLATMILALLISFIICHLPMMLLRIFYKDYKSNPAAYVFSHLFQYSSACISPIIYVFMSNEYRNAYKHLFNRIKTTIMKLFR